MTQSSADIGNKIEAILVEKGPDGEYVYSKQEVRDFIVACIFEMGLDVTPELQGSMVSFLSELSVEEDAPTEDILEQVRLYFIKNPLPASLLAHMNQAVQRDILDNAELFKSPAQQRKALELLDHKKAQTQKIFRPNPWQGLAPRRGIRAAS